MKLAISNIAWAAKDESDLFPHLRNCGVKGIEVAPTKLWPEWKGATAASAQSYRKHLENEGFEIPALQALLFGRPDLQLFDFSARSALKNHFQFLAELACALGAKVLVFGSPKNRQRGQLATEDALNYAADVMRELGDLCHQYGLCIGWEHNPWEYGCDFITNAADARIFVDRVQSPGLQLHLDSSGLHMCGGSIERTIQKTAPFIHYHASEPMLAPLQNGTVNHAVALAALHQLNYDKWISIEMKQVERKAIVESIQFLHKLFTLDDQSICRQQP